MGARGGLVVELIEPVAGSVGFYRDALPTDNAFSVRLHHLGTFIPTGEEEWDRLRRILAGADRAGGSRPLQRPVFRQGLTFSQPSFSSLIAFSRSTSGFTSSLIGSFSKSANQRSGVING